MTGDTFESENEPDKTWTAFIWKNMFSNYDIHEKYGIEIWKYIRPKWRYWWVDSLKDRFPQIFNNITINYPIPIIDDRAMNLE